MPTAEQRRAHIERTISMNRARVWTPESRAKTSAALRALWKDPEYRARMEAERASRRAESNAYDRVHLRARRLLKDQPCALADETCKGRLEVALRHQDPKVRIRFDDRMHPYSPQVEDYFKLCASHHKRYDGEAGPNSGRRPPRPPQIGRHTRSERMKHHWAEVRAGRRPWPKNQGRRAVRNSPNPASEGRSPNG